VLTLDLSFYGYIKQDGVIKTGNGIMENRKWNYLSYFLVSDQETSRSDASKNDFRNRKWNYFNRKWNYFPYFYASDQETSLATVVLLDQMLPKMISETGNGIILTGNGIISPTFMPLFKKLL
jgi:hypothetical protein